MTAIETRNELLGKTLVENLKKRNFEAWYCPDAAAAVGMTMDLLPKGCSVSWGGSETIRAIGLVDEVRNAGYDVVDRDTAKSPEERYELHRRALLTDFYLMSANAISQDGELVNVDGNGNRVAALCFGPKNVLVIVGVNKVAQDLDSAIKRARSTASPINAARFMGKTPCAIDGICHDCKSDDCICSQIVLTRMCRPAGRIKVIVVGQDMGF